MSNKTQLQSNNIQLQAHLQDILALPNVNDVKNGQYVWKKYEIDKSTEILNPKFTADFVPSRDPHLKIINKNFGMPTEATYIDFFDGFKDSSGRVFTKDGDRLKTPWGYVYTYYESQNAMHLRTTHGTEQPTEFTFTGTKQITTNEQMKNFVGYVVSDNESAYPDDGEKDGYWYERVLGEIGIIEKFFGCTEYVEDTFTLSQSAGIEDVTVNHSLGKIPKLIFIYTENYSFPSDGNYYLMYGIIDNVYYNTGGHFDFTVDKSAYINSTRCSAVPYETKNPTSSSFVLSGTSYYMQGQEYKVITMA